jgi:hypothetical protein
MQNLTYALRFKGNAAPPGDDPGVLKVQASAERPVELAGSAPGAAAQFASDVRMIDAATFDENGSIDFGGGTRLTFATVGRGTVGPSVWRVVRGEGKLAGATGFITSNFHFNMAGEVTDNQLHVLFVP